MAGVLACPQCGYSPDHSTPSIPLSTSRFETLLSTNEILTDEEQRTFSSFVSNAQSALVLLRDRIATVRALLKELEKNERSITAAVRKHRRTLNPVRGLPEDLLKEIFFHGGGMYLDASSHFSSAADSLNLTEPPWLYGRVCRRWKKITTHTPLLWSRIKVEDVIQRPLPIKVKEPQKMQQSLPKFALSLISIFLSRSSAVPLDVYLSMPESNFSRSDDRTYAILALLFTQSRRFKTLFLNPAQIIDTETFFDSDSFSSLERLHISVISNGRSRRWPIHQIRIVAPYLRVWSTDGEPASSLSAALSNQITQFICTKFSCREFLQCIALLPTVQKLTVNGGLFGPWADSAPISLKQLAVLTFGSASEMETDLQGLGPFVNPILCPSLSFLDCANYTQVSASMLQKFEKRSKFALKHLEICEDQVDFVAALQNTFALKELVIQKIESASTIQEVLHQLRPSPLDPDPATSPSHAETSLVPLPNLHRLELYFTTSLTELDLLEAVFECMILRSSAMSSESSVGDGTSTTPSEMLISAPNELTMLLRTHPRLEELRLLGMTIWIVAR